MGISRFFQATRFFFVTTMSWCAASLTVLVFIMWTVYWLGYDKIWTMKQAHEDYQRRWEENITNVRNIYEKCDTVQPKDGGKSHPTYKVLSTTYINTGSGRRTTYYTGSTPKTDHCKTLDMTDGKKWTEEDWSAFHRWYKNKSEENPKKSSETKPEQPPPASKDKDTTADQPTAKEVDPVKSPVLRRLMGATQSTRTELGQATA